MDGAGFLGIARLVPHPMLLLTDDGTVVAANAAAHESLVPAGERLEGRPLADLTTDPPARLAEYLRLCARSEEPVLGAVSLRQPNGDALELRGWGSRAPGDGNRIALHLQDTEAGQSELALLDRRLAERGQAERERLWHAEHEARLAVEELAGRLSQLQALTAALAAARCRDDVVQATLTHAPPVLGASAAAVSIYGEDGTTLDFAGQVGFSGAALERQRSLPTDEDGLLMTTVARTGQPVWIEGPEEMLARSAVAVPYAAPAGVQALAFLPLHVGGRALGVMSLGFHVRRRLSDEEQAFALTAAGQCAQALDRARAYEAEASARAAAEEANRAKDAFLATLSHELRTPLTSILGWAHMLRTRALEPAATKRALATIERNARTQSQLIEDILDVSRIVAGKLRLAVRLLDPAAIVRAAVEVVRPTAEARRVRLEASIDDVGVVAADPDRLQQIASNLLSNAVKFTPSGGAVEVRLDRDGGRARLRIIDSGQGIDPEFLPHVFERFRQADGSDTRAQGGLGLGLAIAGGAGAADRRGGAAGGCGGFVEGGGRARVGWAGSARPAPADQGWSVLPIRAPPAKYTPESDPARMS